MQKTQKVSFVLSENDLVEALRYFLKFTPAGRRWKWRRIARVEVCFILVVTTIGALTHSMVFGIVLFALGQLGLLFGATNMGTQLHNLGYAKNQIRIACAPTTIEINSEAFILENEYLNLWRKWQHLELVAHNDNYLYILSGSKIAHIVPKRAFNQEDEFAQFCIAAKLYWQSAKQVPNQS